MAVRERLARIGLTGGIATGKSFCLRRFAELGAATLDTDMVARQVVEPGTPGFEAVVRRFGKDILTPAGAIDRAALGRIVFADAEARRDLERIVHPAIYAAVDGWLDERNAAAQESRGPRVAVVAIPLLYETQQQQRFDRVVVAACPPEVQTERLTARDGMSREDAQRRIDAQMPIDEKRRLADFVIDTAGTFDETTRQVDRVWASIQPPD